MQLALESRWKHPAKKSKIACRQPMTASLYGAESLPFLGGPPQPPSPPSSPRFTKFSPSQPGSQPACLPLGLLAPRGGGRARHLSSSQDAGVGGWVGKPRALQWMDVCVCVCACHERCKGCVCVAHAQRSTARGVCARSQDAGVGGAPSAARGCLCVCVWTQPMQTETRQTGAPGLGWAGRASSLAPPSGARGEKFPPRARG